MEVREITTEYRLGHWAQIIQERIESGLTIKKFCEEAELQPNVYYYWQRKLRKVAYAQLQQQETHIPSGFAEVKLIEPHRKNSKGATLQLHIEVNGVQFSADETYPVESLAYLLKELVRTC